MSSCTTAPRTRRTLMEIALECGYGSTEVEPPSYVPIFDVFNPVNAAFQSVSPVAANESYDQTHSHIIDTGYRFNGQVLLHGSGDPTSPPPWAKLIELAGFERLTTPTSTVYRPMKTQQRSGRIRTWLDGYRHESSGTRSSLVLEGDTGQFVRIRFDAGGRYADPIIERNPTPEDSAIIPIRFCDVGLVVHGDGFDWSPIVKRTSLQIGMPFQRRNSAGESITATEVGHFEPTQARWSIDVEQQTLHNIFALGHAGHRFGIEMTLGTGLGNRWKFTTQIVPGSRTAKLAGAPRHGDQGGTRIWSLDFALTGRSSDYLQLELL